MGEGNQNQGDALRLVARWTHLDRTEAEGIYTGLSKRSVVGMSSSVNEEAQGHGLAPIMRLLLVLFTAVACVGLAYYAEFVLGIVVVYTHLFYIPILLTGLWYQKRAVYLALGLGLVHVLMTYYSPLPLTVNELARAAIFVLVAYVIGLVSAKELETEEVLRASEAKYRAVVENANEAIVVAQDNLLKFVNPRTSEIMGYSERELTSTPFYEFIHPDDRKLVLENYRKRLKGEESTPVYAFRVIDKAGTIRWVEINAVVITWDGFPATLNFLTDITPRKEAEETMLLLSTVVRTSLDAIAVASPADGTLLFGNDAFLNQWKITGDYHRLTFNDCFEDTDERLATAVQATIAGGWTGELRAKAADGSSFPVSVTSSPVVDETGRTLGLLGVFRDISERERLLTELSAKNREMQQFTYTVSHDLRSPLVTIQGFAGMLRKDLEHDANEKAVTDLEYIEKAATKMDTLLSDTLKLSRIGRMVNPPENVPFGEIVQGALEQTAGDLQAHHIDVTVAEDFPTVHVDRMRIEELLVNLITNSVKYRAGNPPPKIELGYRSDGKETVFFVRDNGIGIEKSQAEKVFDLFYQVDRSGGGTGAGLAIVKRIVEVHGGRIWIESELRKGCAVCFTLPLS